MARTARGKGHQRFARRRVTATLHVRIDQGRFIAPVNSCSLGAGLRLNSGVLLVEPSLSRLGALFVRVPPGRIDLA